MKKSFKAFVKNALVYALAASMLVSTPLTASAAGLNGVFSISNGYQTIGNESSTGTGTVSATDTGTRALTDADDGKVVGIVLDQDTITTEVKKEAEEFKATAELKATVLFDDGVDDASKAAINNKIRWVSSDPKTVSLSLEKDADGKVDRTKCILTPKKGGKVTVTASIKLPSGDDCSATATVIVKEYATGISLDRMPSSQYVGHTLDLNLWYDLVPATANDDITWSISATDCTATISDTDVVTFKSIKKGKTDGKVTVTAVTEKGKTASKTIQVLPGNPAKSIAIESVEQIEKAGEDKNIATNSKKTAAKAEVVDGTITVKAKMTPKSDTDNDGVSTDVITWTSNKTNIVAVGDASKEGNTGTVELTPLSVGKAVVTGKTSSGRSVKLTVTVIATLTGLDLHISKDDIYTGQSLELDNRDNLTRTPEENKDALKWEITQVKTSESEPITKAKDIKKYASINNKGVLKVVNQLPEDGVEITVKVSKKNTDIADTDTVTLKQSSIKSITVKDNKKKVVGTVTAPTLSKTGEAQNTNVNKTTTYDAEAESDNGLDATTAAESLQWTTSNAKVVTVDQNGKITALKKGSATITVSGIWLKPNTAGTKKTAKVIKVKYKVTVKQPVTSIALNKSLIVVNPKKNNAAVTSAAFKATVKPSNANAKTVTWKVDGASETASAKIAKGKVTLKANQYQLGDSYEVTAQATSGIATSATVKVTHKTSKLQIKNSDGDILGNTKSGSKKNILGITLGEGVELTPEITWKDAANTTEVREGSATAGFSDTEGEITYTVAKGGNAKVLKNDNGKITVYGVKVGTVKITAKAVASGKSTSFTVVVGNPNAD